MTMQKPIRDADFGHDFAANAPSTIAGVRMSPLAMAHFRRDLRAALKNFPPQTMADELAQAMLFATGSKGVAFSVLDAAAKEVAK